MGRGAVGISFSGNLDVGILYKAASLENDWTGERKEGKRAELVCLMGGRRGG